MSNSAKTVCMSQIPRDQLIQCFDYLAGHQLFGKGVSVSIVCRNFRDAVYERAKSARTHSGSGHPLEKRKTSFVVTRPLKWKIDLLKAFEAKAILDQKQTDNARYTEASKDAIKYIRAVLRLEIPLNKNMREGVTALQASIIAHLFQNWAQTQTQKHPRCISVITSLIHGETVRRNNLEQFKRHIKDDSWPRYWDECLKKGREEVRDFGYPEMIGFILRGAVQAKGMSTRCRHKLVEWVKAKVCSENPGFIQDVISFGFSAFKGFVEEFLDKKGEMKCQSKLKLSLNIVLIAAFLAYSKVNTDNKVRGWALEIAEKHFGILIYAEHIKEQCCQSKGYTQSFLAVCGEIVKHPKFPDKI